MRALLIACAAAILLAPPSAGAQQRAPDPIETLNRATFTLNERLDGAVFTPVASGWAFVTPIKLRVAVESFFLNAAFPLRFVTTLLQGRPVDAGEETARFVVNTTMGCLGFFDPATSLGLDLHREDFGQTFAVWGLPEGPYLVLPLLGPSTGRDAIGGILDGALTPRSYAALLDVVNTRAMLLDDVRLAREASLDFYAFARSAYLDSRRDLIFDNGRPREESPDDLYELEDDLYEIKDE